MLLFYQKQLLKEKNKNDFFWHWYEQQEILKNGLWWEENFYQDLEKNLFQEKGLKKFISPGKNPKKQTIVFDENLYFQYDNTPKQKKITRQHQYQEKQYQEQQYRKQQQYRAEEQKQFQVAAKKQYEIKIQNQKQQKELQYQKQQQKRNTEQQQIQTQKQYHAEMQVQMQEQIKKQYQNEVQIQKQQKNKKQNQDQFKRQNQMQFQEQLKKDKKQSIWKQEQQKIKQQQGELQVQQTEQQGYFIKIEKNENNKEVKKVEDSQKEKSFSYFWMDMDNLKEQKENSIFWYSNALQQQNQKEIEYFTKSYSPEKKETEEKKQKKTNNFFPNKENNEVVTNVTDKMQNISKLYGKTKRNVSIWKKEEQQQKLEEKAKKETIQNMINESLEQIEQPKKQQHLPKVSKNIDVDTLLFHLTEKLLEERERSLRGNKKI